MKSIQHKLKRFGGIVLSMAVSLFMAAGCGMIDAPTASMSSEYDHNDFWNPEPGFSITGDHPVPIVNDNYWETLFGPSVNPLRFIRSIVNEIDGDIGGTVTLGYHNYAVPAGAVDGDVMFTMQYASMDGIAVDCGPSPIEFDIPVTLTLSYRGTQYDNSDDNSIYQPEYLRIYFMTEDGEYREIDGSTLDQNQKTVTTEVSHFSRYILG